MIFIYDNIHMTPTAAQRDGTLHGTSSSPETLVPSVALRHPKGFEARCVQWRPHAGGSLAVGCDGGELCLWNIPTLSDEAGGLDTHHHHHQQQQRHHQAPVAASVTVIKSIRGTKGAIRGLSWCPKGRLLAFTQEDQPGLTLLDAGTLSQTRIQTDLSPLDCVSWSPCGTYLITGRTSRSVRKGAGTSDRRRHHRTEGKEDLVLVKPQERGKWTLWVTDKWTSQSWEAPSGSGDLRSVVWAPHGLMVLLVFARWRQPVCLRLSGARVGPTGSNVVGAGAGVGVGGGGGGGGGGQLVSVKLPELELVRDEGQEGDVSAKGGSDGGDGGDGDGGDGGGGGSLRSRNSRGGGGEEDSGVIAGMAMNAQGTRLAVGLRGDHPAAGCVALYATDLRSTFHVTLIGYVVCTDGQTTTREPIKELTFDQAPGRGSVLAVTHTNGRVTQYGVDGDYNRPAGWVS